MAVKITKVFKSGNSLSVRLPKEFRIKEKELGIAKVGRKIVLFPPEEKWDVIFDELKSMEDVCKGYLEEREQPPVQERGLF